jgi:hypothetical protein
MKLRALLPLLLVLLLVLLPHVLSVVQTNTTFSSGTTPPPSPLPDSKDGGWVGLFLGVVVVVVLIGCGFWFISRYYYTTQK